MSDYYGNLEAASNDILGAPGTEYEAPLAARGLEPRSADNATPLNALQLEVSMQVTQPGDWIRVVTGPDLKKVDICHIPPGNPENYHEISVSINAVAEHLVLHGDLIGPCPE